MRLISLALGLMIGLIGSSAFGQSCYSSAYQSQPEAFALSAQTQTITVPVQITVQAQPVAVSAPAPVAAPAPCQQSYGAPSCGSVGYSYGSPVAVPFAVAVPSYGFSAGFSYGSHVGYGGGFRSFSTHRGVIQQGFAGDRRLSAFGAIGGGGSNIVARDRKGTAVNANFNNSLVIKRGLFGNIKSVEADQPRRGLGSLLPF